jgi:uncharacterized protein YabN with tetrapyrrole methylase and pyrophosphatase domain
MSGNGGSLTVVGIGIRAPEQTTPEATAQIERADKVYSLVENLLAEYWIHSLNENTESLLNCYAVGKDRRQTYREIVEIIVAAVGKGQRVCAATYGHPGVFAYPFHESIRRLRGMGFPAVMLAAISAEDCLFADLGIDPASSGCRSYEATDFLVYRRPIEAASSLILWQIGVIAELGCKNEERAWNRDGLVVLTQRLLQVYPAGHEVVVYEAACLPIGDPTIARIALAELPDAPVTTLSTLYVPPSKAPRVDRAMLRRLRMA